MATKSVLISYGENRRVLQVSVDVERVHLLELEQRNLCATIANNVCIQHSSNLGILYWICGSDAPVMRYGLGVL